MKNSKYLFLLLIIPILVLFTSRSFSLPYTEEIKKVEIQSNNYPEPGSWHIDKSAEWTGFGKARVTFDINSVMKTVDGRYMDVIFVMDISGSMGGSKIERAKQDAIDLTNYLLSDSHNRIALITFDSSSEVISGFTNNKDDMVNYISNLTDKGNTNYNAGLLNVDIVMGNYVKDDNKDLVLLFLTDGYPNEDTPNQTASYKILKDKYPYMTINGIQYEMGKDIIQEIIEISDNQFIADQDTLNNVLFDAAVTPITYDNFVVSDYINDDYFDIESEDDIVVPFGNVTIENENGLKKVVWDLENYYKTGHNAKMTINLKLKEEFHDIKGLYPTNKSEKIISKLPDEQEKTRESELTPVLKNAYKVIYDTNTPDGCNLPTIQNEEHFVYQLVTKRTETLTCLGYIFKGWYIDDDDRNDVTIINDDTFIMPPHDVYVRATWTKQEMDKTMDGTIHEKMTLYKVLEKAANDGVYAKKYTGDHQDSYNGNGEKNIYYWYASNASNAEVILNKNNVLFANHCWQMIRTTDTGGVKLIYNGEEENGKCLNSRGNHVGYNNIKTKDIRGTYYFGTDYSYDETNNNFVITGNVEFVEITSSNMVEAIPSVVGKYTCLKNTTNATCSELYFIDSYFIPGPNSYTNDNAYVIVLSSTSQYSQFGKLKYNKNNDSLAYAGYMYNIAHHSSSLSPSFSIFNGTSTIQDNNYFSSEIDYGNIESNKYSLINPQPISSLDNYNDLVGKYYIRSENYTSSTEICYILKVEGSNIYCKYLKNGDLIVSMVVGDSYIDNNNGTYTITNLDNSPAYLLTYSEWYSVGYRDYLGKYYCDGFSDTCSNIKHLVSTGCNGATCHYWQKQSSYKFSSDVEYNDGVYTLTGDIQTIWDLQDGSERSKINTHHYTCLSDSTSCSSTVYFINYYSGVTLHYIKLSNVSNMESAIYEMLFENTDDYKVNLINSTIKTGIDEWYKKYIYNDYDQYVEDTIYCNNRNIKTIGQLDPNGGVLNSKLYFGNASSTTTLTCNYITDKFSTLNDNAKLKYKVGLSTIQEMLLLGNSQLRKTGEGYFTMSPNIYDTYYSEIHRIFSTGTSSEAYAVGSEMGVRPVISLIPDIEYTSGDGSMENPYIIDTSGD